jgi:hypothetical protein
MLQRYTQRAGYSFDMPVHSADTTRAGSGTTCVAAMAGRLDARILEFANFEASLRLRLEYNAGVTQIVSSTGTMG